MRHSRSLALAAVAAAGVTMFATVPAQATTFRAVHRFSQSDHTPDASIRFVSDGVRIVTPTADDWAYGIVSTNKPLSKVRALNWNFQGTGQIAQYIAVDADNNRSTGDGGEDGDLVGEMAYGGHDVWLSSGATEAMKRAAPSCDGSDAVATAPMTAEGSAQLIADGHCTGGSGSAWHGDLAQWGAALPNARVRHTGFQVFDQVVNGKLKTMDLGSTRLVFSHR